MEGWRISLIVAALTALALLAGCPGGSQNGTGTGPAKTGGNSNTAAAPNGGQDAPEQGGGPVFDPAMTLNEQYLALKERQQVPESVTEMMATQMKGITASGIFNNAVVAETQAPRFVLPSTTGELVSLDTELAKSPVVLVFFRGGW